MLGGAILAEVYSFAGQSEKPWMTTEEKEKKNENGAAVGRG